MLERRRFPRKKFETPIFSFNISPAWTQNISIGGICLQINEELIEGKCQSFEFYLPKGYPILALGTAIWKKLLNNGQYQVGLYFRDLDDYSRRQIVSLVQEEENNGVREKFKM